MPPPISRTPQRRRIIDDVPLRSPRWSPLRERPTGDASPRPHLSQPPRGAASPPCPLSILKKRSAFTRPKEMEPTSGSELPSSPHHLRHIRRPPHQEYNLQKIQYFVKNRQHDLIQQNPLVNCPADMLGLYVNVLKKI